ncbi:MAG: response regulator transcription factor [Gammaproteobacteria bacterium]|nr:response regulator transcription factor [Gammaproteobacteria bacterium]
MLQNPAGTGPADEGATRRIMVVDDDPVMRAILRGYLEDAGYGVTEAEDGERLLDALPRLDPALMLLDVKLPGTNGFDLLRSIRARSDLPVIMVTSCSETRNRVEGLELGADDYVTKPFNARELIARVRTVLRRVAERGAAEPLEIGGGWAFDRERRRLVGAGGRQVSLTTAECAILAALAELPGRPISRDVLAMRMGRRLGGPDDRSIDVLVSRIRRKLAVQCDSEPIRSIRNVGYMLDTDASSRSDDQ